MRSPLLVAFYRRWRLACTAAAWPADRPLHIASAAPSPTRLDACGKGSTAGSRSGTDAVGGWRTPAACRRETSREGAVVVVMVRLWSLDDSPSHRDGPTTHFPNRCASYGKPPGPSRQRTDLDAASNSQHCDHRWSPHSQIP